MIEHLTSINSEKNVFSLYQTCSFLVYQQCLLRYQAISVDGQLNINVCSHDAQSFLKLPQKLSVDIQFVAK